MAQAVIRLAGIRGIIARKMSESLRETAQLSFFSDCDVSRVIALRSQWSSAGVRIGYEDVIAHNLVKVLADFPTFNAIETDKGVEPQQAIHVSCAMALDNGLVAPAIFDVQSKTLVEIAEARTELLSRARLGKLTVAEMTGGTISISNLGLTRVTYFTPILNRPQQAILGFGRIVPTPVVDEAGKIAIAPMMGVSLTVDHRIHDGAAAGAFLTAFVDRLERLETGLA
jgi:pyruvate/2-oxoglutarate dehydrogenase complex dihydrolipoamide acyltransferase (E2) component